MSLSLVEFNGYNGKVWSDDRILLVKLAGAVSPNGAPMPVQYLGAVGGIAVPVTVIPTLTVHATYVANDYVGENNVAMNFAGAARIAGGSGYVVNAMIEDNVLASVAGELWLFRTAPAGLGLDSAPFTVTDADARNCIGVIPFTTYYTSVLNSVAMGDIKIPIGFTCAPGSTSIYGAFKTGGAPGYTGNDIQFRLFIEQY